jgi:hypothetical protein
MDQNSLNPPIPYPSITESDKTYFFAEIAKWIFNYKTSANRHDSDLIRIYKRSEEEL